MPFQNNGYDPDTILPRLVMSFIGLCAAMLFFLYVTGNLDWLIGMFA